MEVTIYKCFIGSPSDTSDERKFCKEVFDQINRTIGEKFNFRLESLMWEDNSRPSFGEDGQDVINRQLLLQEYNIFIGIMWSRFGTPTLRSESGTLEEFEDAYQKYKNNKEVEICMYFNKKDIPQNSIHPEQIGKVFEFKMRVSELGGLYNEYAGAEQFKENLRIHLTNYLLEKHNVSNANETRKAEDEKNDAIKSFLTENLAKSLKIFQGENPCWIEPIVSRTNLISSNYTENYETRINLSDLVETPPSVFIKSPPQFGLTTLAHYLILNAWKKGDLWVYLDATDINRNAIEKTVANELKRIYKTDDISLVKCILVDSWKDSLLGGKKILKGLSNTFKGIPIIVMETIDGSEFLQEPESENIEREFEVMHLLALPKTEIRKMVSSYNEVIYIGEDDKVLNKIVLDLDTLNIHRTPLNCLTLLKVSEKYFDERTINRSDMLDKVLFILFELSSIPKYQSKPDLKDCEFILGSFCENMLRSERYLFTKNEFVDFSKNACAKSYIEVDVNTLFDILYFNGIIISKQADFTFRATYWLFYFAAHRMHANPTFSTYIFESGKYVNYPELIEFYTGIDRRRTDALEILERDISVTSSDVLNKLGLPEHIDPYLKVEWNPSEENIDKAKDEISANVQMSKLPTQIKDQHSDAKQNQLRPYDQGITTILNEYSLAVLMRKITASSRALRNSDYADPIIKKKLLNSIITSYEQVAKAMLILAPELAITGRAAFGGQGFYLDANFGDTVNARISRIIQSIPSNIIKFFKDDIDSDKLGPLILEKIASEKIPLNKYLLMLLLINIRCSGWRKAVETYINQLSKNSFYLFDLMGNLRSLYFYDYTTDVEISEMKQLLQLGYAKHEFGSNKPSKEIWAKFTQHILKNPKQESE
jgi:hypothetical protein